MKAYFGKLSDDDYNNVSSITYYAFQLSKQHFTMELLENWNNNDILPNSENFHLLQMQCITNISALG